MSTDDWVVTRRKRRAYCSGKNTSRAVVNDTINWWCVSLSHIPVGDLLHQRRDHEVFGWDETILLNKLSGVRQSQQDDSQNCFFGGFVIHA